MKKRINILKDILLNIFFRQNVDIFFVVENANWVTDREWKNISDGLNKIGKIKSCITSTAVGLRNKKIHFGSVNTLIAKKGLKKVHFSNKIILTWFHVVEGDERLRFITDLNKRVSTIHTSCEITKGKLIEYGLDKSKIVVIPLGIDLNFFKTTTEQNKILIRKSLNISEREIIIGSFQKDGEGWGKGDVPKLVKGPDIFCDVIESLSKKYPIHVMLTGPARGYVINRLVKAGVKYSHVYLRDFYDILPYYQVLDLYLVCSREEGGPKALIESMSCGVPLVSTRVGMAPELIIDGQNGYLTDVGDVGSLYHKACAVIESQLIKSNFCSNGLETVRRYSYDLIVKIYWEKIYSKLI